MISKFNAQLIEELKRVNTSRFDDEYFGYKKLIEQGAPDPAAPDPSAAAAPAPAGGAPAPDMGGGMPPEPGAEPEPETVPNKPYPEILTLIAKALTVNINQEPTEDRPENIKNLKSLKNFVGEVLEGGKVKQMDNAKALRMLDAVQKTINNVVGGLEEI